jgi:hypothetical protein
MYFYYKNFAAWYSQRLIIACMNAISYKKSVEVINRLMILMDCDVVCDSKFLHDMDSFHVERKVITSSGVHLYMLYRLFYAFLSNFIVFFQFHYISIYI